MTLKAVSSLQSTSVAEHQTTPSPQAHAVRVRGMKAFGLLQGRIAAAITSLKPPPSLASPASECAPHRAAAFQPPHNNRPSLYIFEGDDRGKSKCDRLCTAVWPIVFALDSAQPTGDWIIIQRDDKRKQWAYKGLPVYTFYDDTRYDVPKGEDLSFGWWLNEGVAGPAIETYGKYKSKEAGRGPVWRKLEP